MKITYLGQAGLRFETGKKTILIDPYLSDSVAESQPQNARRQPLDKRFLQCKPDMIVITHAHGDHYDKETLCHFLSDISDILVLSPYSVWTDIRKFGGKRNRYVMFNNGTEWTEDDIRFRAVKAEHSDIHAVGVIITAEEKNYYVTGDTLYNETVFESLPKIRFEAVFLPVNGQGNNMNFADAERFASRLRTRYVVPMHIGMFDDITADDWKCEHKRVPQIYREINLP